MAIINASLKDTMVFTELVEALKTILNDERIDEKVREEYSNRLSHHFEEGK
jgi:hypothetical protein